MVEYLLGQDEKVRKRCRTVDGLKKEFMIKTHIRNKK